jgi:hypothetical protein
VQTPDFQRFNELISGMGRIYGTVIDRVFLDAYWVALADWELEDFEQACGHLMRTSKFMPRPADFTELRKAGQETAGEVFASLCQWTEYTPRGYVEKPGIPRPIASALRAIGGADAYMMCDAEKLHFLERRFCEHYDQITQANETREAVPAIAERPDWLQLQVDTIRRRLTHDVD